MINLKLCAGSDQFEENASLQGRANQGRPLAKENVDLHFQSKQVHIIGKGIFYR